MTCHTRAFTTRPPSRGRPGRRLKRASSRLRNPSLVTISPSTADWWAAGCTAALSATASARLTSGPAKATARAPRAVGHSRSTLATPPSRNRVMLRTFTPWLRATRAWPISWSTTETNSSRAVARATSQRPPSGRVVARIRRYCRSKARVAANRIRNQVGWMRRGMPRTRNSCQPSPTVLPLALISHGIGAGWEPGMSENRETRWCCRKRPRGLMRA